MPPAPKKATAGPSKKGPRKPKAKSKVVESSASEDEPEVTVSKKEKHHSLQKASQDTDIEEIPNPKEVDPEEELGKLFIASQIHASHLPRSSKKKWPKIGRHLFMDFSSRALK
jgi:hypothetical protein